MLRVSGLIMAGAIIVGLALAWVLRRFGSRLATPVSVTSHVVARAAIVVFSAWAGVQCVERHDALHYFLAALLFGLATGAGVLGLVMIWALAISSTRRMPD